ncbi:MAG TPA: sodium:proton antiporter NhaD, partial [Cyclobacteriaceae bacterium]|nr:sodium:proton antiporter NhaD [Cyclobacteriaceae bacterium]
MESLAVFIFILGYILIALEHPIKINKTPTAMITGVLCWTIVALATPEPGLEESHHYISFADSLKNASTLGPSGLYQAFVHSELSMHLGQIASILFFLMGAMTIVELVDAHHGFRFITDRIKTLDVRKLLWIICWVTFFLSAILDNLTTAIVMVSLTRKLVQDDKKRLFFAGMIIVAANAGGAWSPIGDVTTTMLWIGGQISTMAIIKSIFIPSVVCLLVPLVYLSFKLKGKLDPRITIGEDEVDYEYIKGGKTMLVVGVGALVGVPIFKTVTHLPPYMGILLGLGVLWVVSELINPHLD